MTDRPARFAPVWALAVTMSRKAARGAHANREQRQALAVANADREALRAHFALACQQRDDALAAARAAEERTAELRRQLAFWMDIRADTLPDASEYGAWISGSEPPG